MYIFWEVSSVHFFSSSYYVSFKGSKTFSLLRWLPPTKEQKLNLLTLKSLRELLHFMAIRNILLHSK